MNTINFLSKKDTLRHLIVWVLIATFLDIVDPVLGTVKAKIIGLPMIVISYMFVYYFLNLVIFKKFLENRYLLLIGWVIISYIIFALVIFLINHSILPYLGGQNPRYPVDVIIINSLLLFSFIFFSALGNYLNRLGTQKLKLQYEKEKVLITKELNFLKNQFNSHITFNFLNFCYSHVHKSSEDAAEAIELFSDMLRYSLKIKPDENVPLRKEIEYIENFISLQKHLSSKVFVDLKFEGSINTKFILPRILITFVENAFKHGRTNDINYPVEIYLMANQDNIIFRVRNKKNYKEKITESGIGQQNVKQMLEFFYKQDYYLNIQQDSVEYFCELTLKI